MLSQNTQSPGADAPPPAPEAEIDYVVELIAKHVKRLRDMSPLWEMVQEGIDLKSIQWTAH